MLNIQQRGDGIVDIDGVKFSEELLRAFCVPTPDGIWFRIVKTENGVATVEQKIDVTKWPFPRKPLEMADG